MTLERLKELEEHMAKIEAVRDGIRYEKRTAAAFADKNAKVDEEENASSKLANSKIELKELESKFPQVVPQTLKEKFDRLEKIAETQDA